MMAQANATPKKPLMDLSWLTRNQDNSRSIPILLIRKPYHICISLYTSAQGLLDTWNERTEDKEERKTH
jgi:hypothetical protein